MAVFDVPEKYVSQFNDYIEQNKDSMDDDWYSMEVCKELPDIQERNF